MPIVFDTVENATSKILKNNFKNVFIQFDYYCSFNRAQSLLLKIFKTREVYMKISVCVGFIE